MKTLGKKSFLLILSFICLANFPLYAGNGDQDSTEQNNSWVKVSADFMSRYVWRGQLLSRTPNIQPSLIFDPGIGLKAGAWGSYDVCGNYAEVDLYLSYEIKGIGITFTDYFVVDEYADFNKYFNYKNENTFHTFEASLSYYGPEKVPLYLTANTMFFGFDKKLDKTEIDTVTNDTTYTYKNQFSTYFELGYTYKNITFFAGITPFACYYGDKWGVVNAGITYRKEIPISRKFSLPIMGSLIFNPQKQNIFIVFGFTI
jgi:hypothetical protein